MSVGLQKFLATLNCIRNAWNRSNQERSIDKLQSDLNEMLFNAKCWTLIVQPSLKPKEKQIQKKTPIRRLKSQMLRRSLSVDLGESSQETQTSRQYSSGEHELGSENGAVDVNPA